MNVSALARKLNISPNDLLERLPAMGFHIGRRAIKIDDRTAQRVLKDWKFLNAKYEKEQADKLKAEKEEEEIKSREPIKIKIPATIAVKELAEKFELPVTKVIKELMKNGVLSSMNEQIDFDTASIVGAELGVEVLPQDGEGDVKDTVAEKELEEALEATDKKSSALRPPVVVVMGHVDHGKTLLLDAIRKTDVVAGEAGGITQHIGAYQTNKNDRLITFIDTPGHEAFTTMRSRGARVADVAILVIAADDGIKPQTKESIKIIKAAGIPFVVAINKIDKPDANPDKIKQELAAENLVPEDYGGKVITVPVSAKKGEGIDQLLETILLVADLDEDELKADPSALAIGTVVESHVDKGEGPVATMLVQNGTLKIGDELVVGNTFYGKVRALKDHHGESIKIAPPSTPVRISGLKSTPAVGDIIKVSQLNKKQKKAISKHDLKKEATAFAQTGSVEKEESDKQAMNMVIRADVLGSLEAIVASLHDLENEEVKVKIVQKGLGRLTEGDIDQAESSGAVVISYNVPVSPNVEKLAKDKKIEILQYSVIYHLLEEVKKRLEAMLSPEVTVTEHGRLKVLAIFRKEKDAMIIGGKVTKGKAVLGAKAKVLREDIPFGQGEITELQQNKVSAQEVTEGNECGMKFSGKPLIEEGDFLEFYSEVSRKKTLK